MCRTIPLSSCIHALRLLIRSEDFLLEISLEAKISQNLESGGSQFKVVEDTKILSCSWQCVLSECFIYLKMGDGLSSGEQCCTQRPIHSSIIQSYFPLKSWYFNPFKHVCLFLNWFSA